MALAAFLFRLWFYGTIVGDDDTAVNNNQRIYYATFTYLDTFAFGALFGWLAARRPAPYQRLEQLFRRRGVGLVLFVVLAYLAWNWADFWQCVSPVCVSSIYLWAGVMLALVIGWSVANSRSPLSRMAASRPLRVLGLLSFGIYCWHPIAQAASSQFALLIGLENQDPRIGGFLLFGLYLATTFFVASLTYGLVERPFLGLKDRLRGRSGATPQFAWRQVALVAAMLFAFIVVLDHAIWGLPTELVKRCVVYVAWAVLGVGLWLAVARRLLYAPSAGRVAEPGTRRRVALPWRRCQGRSRTRSCGS